MSKISELSDGGVIQGGDTLIAVRSGGNVKVTYGGSTTANIDGGTIDGTVIGGTTPAAGTFTSLTASGDVNFDSNTLFVDASANAVGIGVSTPAAPLSFGSITNDARIYLRGNTNEFAIGTNGLQTVYAGYQGHVFQTGSFGGAEAMRIDSSGRVGISNSSPSNYTGAGARTLVVGSNSSASDPHGITIVGGSSSTSNLAFTDNAGDASANDYRGLFQYYHPDDSLRVFVASTERMRIDSSGRVTKPYQPAFNVNPLSDQNNIAINTPVTVIFNTEVFDVGSNFASNTFTAPVTGKYQLNLALRLHNIDTAADFYQIKFLTSNRSYLSTADYGGLSSNPNYWTEAFSVLADMDANDTVSITVSQSGGSVQTDIHVETTFSGYLVA
jgi:hypothetical protein